MTRAWLVALVLAGCSKTSTEKGPAGAPPSEALTPPVRTGTAACPAGSLPPDQHYVPDGLCASLVAQNLGRLRQITFAPNGDMFGVTTDGIVRRFNDANRDGVYQAEEITEYARTGGNGNNCHVDAAAGFLYAGSPAGVKRFTYAAGAVSGGAGDEVVTGQPAGGHSFHTVHVTGGYLYVHSGSAGNATNPNSPEYDTDRSLLRRFKLSSFVPGAPFAWSSGEIVTVGLRNLVGYAESANGRMFGVVNGLDDITYKGVDVHIDNPGEQIVELGMGKKYGYPFCFTAQRVTRNQQVVAPGTQLVNERFGAHDDAWCRENSSPPASFVQAHSAPLDIAFFRSEPAGALPERWRKGAFIALHGSWNREPSTGYKVVWLPFGDGGTPPMPTLDAAGQVQFPYEVVFGGGTAKAPKDGSFTWSNGATTDSPRPVGVAVSPLDGALYVSSDQNGTVYRLALAK